MSPIQLHILWLRLTKRKKKHKLPISGIGTEGINTNPGHQRIIKEHYEQLYTHQFDNLSEIDQLLGKEITLTHLI